MDMLIIKGVDEFNQPLQPYHYGEDFSQMICFNYNDDTEEFGNWVEIFVNAEDIKLYEPNLNKKQERWVISYAENIQSEIRDYIFNYKDELATTRSLITI